MADGSTHSILRVAWSKVQSLTEPRLVELEKGRPLRVLLVIGTAELQGGDIRALDEAQSVDLTLQHYLPWSVELRVLRQPSLETLKHWCEGWRPHVFHFVGHGGDQPEPHLFLEPASAAGGPAVEIRAGGIANLFGQFVPQLAILNACRTGLKPELRASRSRAALGLAEVLIRRGVPAVVSTQGDIHGEAAALLMGEFYAQLCSDKPAPIDLALAAARSRVAGSAKFGKKWDWGLPAIYLSASLQTDDLLTLAKIMPGSAENGLKFLDALQSLKDPTSQLPLPVAVRIQVGYDDRRLAMEKLLFGSSAAGRQAIVAVHGEEQSGKSSLIYWLAVNCLRMGRPFIYADFANDNLTWWEALRLLRDGRLQRPDFKGVRLDNSQDPDVVFNRFNHTLNVKEQEGYEQQHPLPAEGQALSEISPDANLAELIQDTGAVTATENPLAAIFESFRSDLHRIAGQQGLVILLDHVDGLSESEVRILRKHLIDPLASDPAPKIQFVIAREMQLFGSATPDHWLPVTGPPGKPGNQWLDGFTGPEILWLSKLWARRYYDSALAQDEPANIFRAFKRQNPNLSLDLSRLDELLAGESLLKDEGQPLLPGSIVRDLTNPGRIGLYLKKLAGLI
jgi:hypothetical protein